MSGYRKGFILIGESGKEGRQLETYAASVLGRSQPTGLCGDQKGTGTVRWDTVSDQIVLGTEGQSFDSLPSDRAIKTCWVGQAPWAMFLWSFGNGCHQWTLPFQDSIFTEGCASRLSVTWDSTSSGRSAAGMGQAGDRAQMDARLVRDCQSVTSNLKGLLMGNFKCNYMDSCQCLSRGELMTAVVWSSYWSWQRSGGFLKPIRYLMNKD